MRGRTDLAVAGRFPVGFYLIAMLFVIFDVEAASFYPWAVQMAVATFGLIEMVSFVVVLAIGYAYVWKKRRLSVAVETRVRGSSSWRSSTTLRVGRKPRRFGR